MQTRRAPPTRVHQPAEVGVGAQRSGQRPDLTVEVERSRSGAVTTPLRHRPGHAAAAGRRAGGGGRTSPGPGTPASARVPGSSNRWPAPSTTASSRPAAQGRQRPPVQLQHGHVLTAHDEQGGGGDLGEPAAGRGRGGRPATPRRRPIRGRRPPPTGRPRPRCWRRSTRSGTRRRSGRARTHSVAPASRRASSPMSNTLARVALLVGGEQVEQQRAQPGLVEHVGHEPVARTVPAAAAPVGEHAPRRGGLGQVEVTLEDHAVDGDGRRRRRSPGPPRPGSRCRRAARSSSTITSSSLVGEKSS